MVVNIPPTLEAALHKMALRQNIAPEVLALNVLRERFRAELLEPRDEWERGLLEAAGEYDVSPPDSALSSEGLYD